MITIADIRIPLHILTCVVTCSAGLAQTEYKVSRAFDDTSAPSAGRIPGSHGASRMQILVAASRLVGVQNKSLTGIRFRRDLSYPRPLTGGVVDMTIRLSTSSLSPMDAGPTFAVNALPSQQVTVFSGPVTFPDSPTPLANANPWSQENSISVTFSSTFPYSSSTLIIDISAVPRVSGAPKFWFVDQEMQASSGNVTVFGQTCSNFTAGGMSLLGNEDGLVIGGTVRVTAFGRPGATPLLLIGARIPGGLDLGVIGAPGCRQYVDALLMLGLAYPNTGLGITGVNVDSQVPADPSLMGKSVFLQGADMETGSAKTNPAGLTSSNGLQLQIGSSPSTLGMSVVRSQALDRTAPLPVAGRVEVLQGPVIRLLYQ